MAKRIPERGALKLDAKPQQKPRDASAKPTRNSWAGIGWGPADGLCWFITPSKYIHIGIIHNGYYIVHDSYTPTYLTIMDPIL